MKSNLNFPNCMNWYSNFRVHACEWLTIFLNCVDPFFFFFQLT